MSDILREEFEESKPFSDKHKKLRKQRAAEVSKIYGEWQEIVDKSEPFNFNIVRMSLVML